MIELLTVGHGTLAEEELVALLRGAGVERVVDVRVYDVGEDIPLPGT